MCGLAGAGCILPGMRLRPAGPAALACRSGLLRAGLGEGAGRPQVGARAVVVKNAQDLRGFLLRAERMRLHRGELGRLAGPDEDGPLAQPQHYGAGQDGEPVPARVDAQPGGHLPGHPQLRDRHTLRRTGPRQQPGRHATCLVPERPDHHVGVVVGLHQLVKGGAECPRDRRELIQGNPPVTGLDPAQRGRAQVTPGRQLVQRPAQRRAQTPDALPDQGVQIGVLLHAQDCMPQGQAGGTVEDMAHEHLTDLLDLDAEVLSEYHQEVTGWVSANLTGRVRVVDVGAGTGTGTLALARQLPDSEVIALDVDEEMLKRIQDKARASGLADRIRTVQADLDQAWPDGLKPADLVWAANSLHHMGVPARAVAQIYEMLRPGGLLAVTELESFPRFLTDPAGAALEERIHAAMARGRDEAGMHMHEDWPARFAEAGFAVESERRFVIALQPPPDSPMAASVTRYAMVSLCRARHGLEDKLSADDIAELDALAPALSARNNLTVRTSRTVWLARKPAG